MEPLDYEDILTDSLKSNGWPADFTSEEVFNHEFGDEKTLPKPAFRKATPQISDRIAQHFLKEAAKIFK